MNIDKLSTFTDVAILGAIEIVGCVFYVYAKPLLVFGGSGGFLLLLSRLMDEPAQSNVVPLRKVTLMVFMSWAGWLLWSISLPAMPALHLGIILSYSITVAALGIYATRRENSNFALLNRRAQFFTAASLLLGLAPVNLASSLPPLVLLAQSLIHATSIFLLFFLRLKLEKPNSVVALFAYSFWILVAWWPVAIGVGMGSIVLSSKHLIDEMAKPIIEPHDLENQAPAPIPKPPQPQRLLTPPVQRKDVAKLFGKMAAERKQEDFQREYVLQETNPSRGAPPARGPSQGREKVGYVEF